MRPEAATSMRTKLPPLLLACLLLLALPVAAAHANGSDDRIYKDCQNSPTGELTGSYSKAQLRHALDNIPGDVSEYSGCYDAIRHGLSPAGGSGGGGGNGTPGGPGGSSGGSGGDRSQTGAGGTSNGTAGAAGASGGAPTANAVPPAGADQPVRVDGAAIAPGELPELGKDAHKLPTPLLVLLALLAVGALVPAGLTIGRRVIARRRA
jgi:hypothetical protein